MCSETEHVLQHQHLKWIPQPWLTKSQLPEVATSNLLSNSEVWTNHRHCLAGNTRTLTRTVARLFTDTASRDLPGWFRAYLQWRPKLLGTLSSLGCHCTNQLDLQISTLLYRDATVLYSAKYQLPIHGAQYPWLFKWLNNLLINIRKRLSAQYNAVLWSANASPVSVISTVDATGGYLTRSSSATQYVGLFHVDDTPTSMRLSRTWTRTSWKSQPGSGKHRRQMTATYTKAWPNGTARPAKIDRCLPHLQLTNDAEAGSSTHHDVIGNLVWPQYDPTQMRYPTMLFVRRAASIIILKLPVFTNFARLILNINPVLVYEKYR